jgi:cytochrome b561
MTGGGAKQTGFAARVFNTSRFIHWITVALVIGLLVTALFGGIDPHGNGNSAFLWHSSLGISVYLLSISRVLLWVFYNPCPILRADLFLIRIHQRIERGAID